MVTTDNIIFRELEDIYVTPSTNVFKPYFCSLPLSFGIRELKKMTFCQESFRLCYCSRSPNNSALLTINYSFLRKWHNNKKGAKKNSKFCSNLPNQTSSCSNTSWTVEKCILWTSAEKCILWTFGGTTSLTSNPSKLHNF